MLHRAVTGAKPDKASHSDVIGIVVFNRILPWNACTTGAFSVPARRVSSSCAPAHPAPARIATRLAAFSTSAAAARSDSAGVITAEASLTGRAPAPVCLEQPVDQVQVARSADGQLAGHRCLPGRRERCGLLVPHVLPGDNAIAPQSIGESPGIP
ncbi:MAG TPA: hypothetical protein VMA72_25105 [Streptosporangiaceae bacterium]|nr:hypothetical protein [Streptosporangiaceae bacterium]